MMITESQNIEFKENWRDEYLKWISGFANAQGGKLYVGVRDSGEVCGIADVKKLLEDIPNKVRDLMGILVDVNRLVDDNKEYLEIVTEAYPYPISYRGHYYLRSGATNQELKGIALDRFMLRKQGRTWDSVPVPSLKTESLTPIQIGVYDDRLEIWNCGVLPEEWTISNLLGKHRSRPYNPDIANVFFRAGEIEAWGRGIERIIAACKTTGSPAPEFQYEGGGLWTTFYFSENYQKKLLSLTQKRPENDQKATRKRPEKTRRCYH